MEEQEQVVGTTKGEDDKGPGGEPLQVLCITGGLSHSNRTQLRTVPKKFGDVGHQFCPLWPVISFRGLLQRYRYRRAPTPRSPNPSNRSPRATAPLQGSRIAGFASCQTVNAPNSKRFPARVDEACRCIKACGDVSFSRCGIIRVATPLPDKSWRTNFPLVVLQPYIGCTRAMGSPIQGDPAIAYGTKPQQVSRKHAREIAYGCAPDHLPPPELDVSTRTRSYERNYRPLHLEKKGASSACLIMSSHLFFLPASSQVQ